MAWHDKGAALSDKGFGGGKKGGYHDKGYHGAPGKGGGYNPYYHNGEQGFVSTKGLGVDEDLYVERRLKLYVGGLPQWIDDQTLQAHFGKYGPLVEATLCGRTEMRKFPFAFITYKHAADADAAFLDGHNFPGLEPPQHLTLRYQSQKEVKDKLKSEEEIYPFLKSPDPAKIWVGSVMDTYDEEELGNFFSQWGLVLLVDRVVSNPEKGGGKGENSSASKGKGKQGRGYAFIHYANREAAIRLFLEPNRHVQFRGRPLELKPSDSAKSRPMDEHKRHELVNRGLSRHFIKRGLPPLPPVVAPVVAPQHQIVAAAAASPPIAPGMNYMHYAVQHQYAQPPQQVVYAYDPNQYAQPHYAAAAPAHQAPTAGGHPGVAAAAPHQPSPQQHQAYGAPGAGSAPQQVQYAQQPGGAPAAPPTPTAEPNYGAGFGESYGGAAAGATVQQAAGQPQQYAEYGAAGGAQHQQRYAPVVSVLLYLIAFFTVIYYFYLQLHHINNPAGDESNDEDHEESRNNEDPWAAYMRIFHLPQDKDFQHDVWGSHNQILRAHVVLRLVLYLAVFPFLAFVWLRCLCAQVLPWLACSNSVKATHARDLWAAGERKLYLLRWRSGSCCGPASAVVELSLSWEDLAAVTAGHVKVQRGNSCRLLLGCCGNSNGGGRRGPPRTTAAGRGQHQLNYLWFRSKPDCELLDAYLQPPRNFHRGRKKPVGGSSRFPDHDLGVASWCDDHVEVLKERQHLEEDLVTSTLHKVLLQVHDKLKAASKIVLLLIRTLKGFYLHTRTNKLYVWEQAAGVLFEFLADNCVPIWTSQDPATNAEVSLHSSTMSMVLDYQGAVDHSC
eukprot:g14948.t1